MGNGRINYEENFKSQGTINCSVSARNLRKSDLGAVIFGCKNHTITECKAKQLFGLPAAHFSYVNKVTPGLPLFLFNYSDRMLHGIYEATSPGKLFIDPLGWTGNGEHRTPYPAQVRIRVREQCGALREELFRPVIADNYYEQSLFWFELDHSQTRKLIELFLSSPSSNSAPPLHNTLLDCTHNFNGNDTSEDEFDQQRKVDIGWVSLASTDQKMNWPVLGDSNNSLPHRSWSSLFKESAFPDTAKKGNLKTDLNKQTLTSWPTVDCPNMDSIATISESHDQHLETFATTVDAHTACAKEIELSVPLTVGEFRSSDNQTLVDKLIQEIGEMKGLQLEQNQKINYLETKIVESELEIQKLRNQLNMVPARQASSSGHFRETDLNSLNSFPEIDDSILIVGGYDGSSWTSDLSLYSPSTDIIKSLTPMTFLRYYTSIAKLNDEVFLFGGVRGGVWYDIVESYNPRSNQWTVQPSLSKKKGSSAGISVLEKLFAIGGGDGVECFAEVEMLDLNLGKWIYTLPMKQERFAPAVADINSTLYVVGGYDGKDYLKSVERFDPREHKWTEMASMQMRRGCHSLVVLNEKLYALGGYDGECMVSTVEVFDPRTCSWMTGESMKTARGYPGAAVIGEKIFVIGGVNDNDDVLDSVEYYKECCGWRSSNSSVGKRCFFSALKF